MAQAARLNARMQKELKLLLTDPPPGASFPSLSDDSLAPSLTAIDALFRGPEGTVYANGVFKINIQIPERYPFQPPIVTFITPIYHPNIDNGGRICLDILNLPPKGTWQPSLNISTVLTSIGLLLCEPNADDGLMHEASREYKYNRQAFDQNARSMTEKYAGAGESENARGSHGSQTNTGLSAAQTEKEGFSESSRKLSSMESLGSSSNWDTGVSKMATQDYSRNHIDIGQLNEANNICTDYKGNYGKLQSTRNKLSLKVPVFPQSRNVETTNIDMPNHCPSKLETQAPFTDPDPNTNPPMLSIRDKPNPPKDATASKGSGSTSTRLNKKVGLVGHTEDEKENWAPIQCLPPQLTKESNPSPMMSLVVSENCKYYNEKLEKQAVNSEMAAEPPLKPVEQPLSGTNNMVLHSEKMSSPYSLIPEAVIVLDSEDSEDENVPVRSKLSLARRCLSRKRKSGSSGF